MKKLVNISLACLLLAGCANQPAESPQPTEQAGSATIQPAEFVSAIVGTWKLGRVEGKMRGESENHELTPEENASVYGDRENVYEYTEDGEAICTFTEAGTQYQDTGSWVMNEDETYSVTLKEAVFTYVYDVSDDSLRRTFEASSPDDRYLYLEFIYLRQN